MDATILENKVAFYRKDIDNPFSVNGFKGTWQFSDHSLIPDTLVGFLLRSFGVGRLKRIPLEDINKLMNEVWEGPGSLEKIFRLQYEMEVSGKKILLDPRDFPKSKKDEEDEFDTLPDLPLNSFDSLDNLSDEDED